MPKRKITWSGRGHAHQLYNATFHQGPHKVARSRPYKYPFSNPGPRRQGRPRAHFSSSHVMDTGGPSSSGTDRHEAHMIPGIDGHRIYGFPNSIITKLRYATYLNMTGSSGVLNSNLFAANGLFDPDLSLGGHQPLYFDNYAALYDQYVVIGSKITAEYASNNTSVGAYCGILGDDDATTTGTLETHLEQNNSISRFCPAAGGPILTLTQTFEPLKDFGVDAKADGSSATAVTANPTELWVYKVWSLPADLTTVTTVYCKVEIEYTVKFSELKTPVQN